MAYDTGIYVIENVANGRRYVGSAVRFSWRVTKHKLNLNRGTHHSRFLQNAWNKYGEASFEFKIVERCQRDRLIEREQHWIDLLNPDYNVSRTAGSCMGVKRSDEFKKKVSQNKKGNVVPDSVKKKISAALSGRKGKPMTEESKKRLSESSRARASGAGRGHMMMLADMKKGIARPESTRILIAKRLSKYTEDQVRDMRFRASSGELHKNIAASLGISKGSVSDAISGRSYRWVK